MSSARPIYMDNHSTTRVDPRVLERMIPYFSEEYGNAASRSHAYGWTAEAATDLAREQIAELIGGRASEILFTSGATESNNLAIKGAARAYRKRGDHAVTVATEHKAVLDPLRGLEREGLRVTYLEPAPSGLVTPEQVAGAMEEGTVLVSVMHVNNEIGVIQPIEAIGAAIKAKDERCLFHCDAAQSAGKVPLDVEAARIDLASLSSHKMYGPKGAGALWARRRPRVKLEPLLEGGGHERGLRSGTLPVPILVGFGAACAISREEMEEESSRVAQLRDRLLTGIRARLGDVVVNGSMEARVAGNLNVSFPGVEGEALLIAFSREVAVSSGAACSSATLEPSYVLRALGLDDDLAHASVRFGLGRFNTEEEVDRVIDVVAGAVERLRARSVV